MTSEDYVAESKRVCHLNLVKNQRDQSPDDVTTASKTRGRSLIISHQIAVCPMEVLKGPKANLQLGLIYFFY